MVEAGLLSPRAGAQAPAKQPLRLSAKDDDTGYPYAVDWVAELLPEFVGEQDGDLIVETDHRCRATARLAAGAAAPPRRGGRRC